MDVIRETQLDESLATISRVFDGGQGANVVFVTGEAGIGKSTLLRAIRDECMRTIPGVGVAMAECSTPLAGQGIGDVEALEPWAQIIARLADPRHEHAHGVRSLVGELAMAWVRVIPIVGDVLESTLDTARIVQKRIRGTGAEGSTATSQQQMFQQYINLLSAVSDRTPLVLMIDDAHWADSSSCNLLFAAARQLQGKRIAFLVAYRPDDVVAERAGEGHPILRIRAELERYNMAAEVGVPRMSAGDLDVLLRARYLDYFNDDQFEEWIARISSGNALFITQYLDMLEEDGVIDRSTGRPRRDYRQIRPPASARAVVGERIRRLDADSKELLRYASVEGDTFTSTVLSRTTEIPQLKLLQRVRVIEENHGVVKSLGRQRVYASQSTAWQFSHALLHSAMYESLMDEERELLHHAVFEVLREEWGKAKEGDVNVEGVAARLAIHAGVLEEHLFAAEVLLVGARATWREYAAHETLSLLAQAEHALGEADVAGAGEGRQSTLLQGEVHLLRGHVHKTTATYADANAAFASALACFDSGGDESRAAEALAMLAAVLEFQEHRDDARSRAEEARKRGDSSNNPGATFDALITLGRIASADNDIDRSLELLRGALAIAETMQDDARIVEALDSIGNLEERLSDNDAARESYNRALQAALRSGSAASEALCRNSIGCLHLSAGEHEDAGKHFSRGLELARAMGDRDAEARILNNIGLVHWWLDRLEESRHAFEQGLEVYRAIGNRFGEALLLSNIADGEAYEGRLDRAIELSLSASELMGTLGYDRHFSNISNSTGVLLRKGGRVDEALEHHRRGAEAARRAQSPDDEARNLGNLAVALAVGVEQLPAPEREARVREALGYMDSCLELLGAGHVSFEYWIERRQEVAALGSPESS